MSVVLRILEEPQFTLSDYKNFRGVSQEWNQACLGAIKRNFEQLGLDIRGLNDSEIVAKIVPLMRRIFPSFENFTQNLKAFLDNQYTWHGLNFWKSKTPHLYIFINGMKHPVYLEFKRGSSETINLDVTFNPNDKNHLYIKDQSIDMLECLDEDFTNINRKDSLWNINYLPQGSFGFTIGRPVFCKIPHQLYLHSSIKPVEKIVDIILSSRYK